MQTMLSKSWSVAVKMLTMVRTECKMQTRFKLN